VRIGIDGQPLQSSARHAGIGRYLLQLVSGLAECDGDFEFVRFLNERADPPTVTPAWARAAVPRSAALRRHAWIGERLRFPSALRRKRIDLFHAQSLAEMGIGIPRPTRRTRVVVTVHDVIPLLFRAEHPAFWPARRRASFARIVPD